MSSVVVLGSINMDIVATCEDIPLSGQTVLGKSINYYPGGKGANQAIAAQKSGAACKIVGAVGEDAFGLSLIDYLASSGVNVDFVTKIEHVATGTAMIAVSQSGENCIIVIPGSNNYVQVNSVLPALKLNAETIALSQLEVPIDEVEVFFKAVKAINGKTILNMSPYTKSAECLMPHTDILIVNEHEYQSLTGNRISIENYKNVHISTDFKSVFVVTLGKDGLVILEYGQAPIHIAGHKIEVVDTTGAGDCFAGWLAGELAQGKSMLDAARRSNLAAAISVSIKGAGPSMPNKDRIDDLLR